MRRANSYLAMMLLPLLSSLPAKALPIGMRPDTLATARTSLVIRTDPDSALVMLDSHPAGMTPVSIDTLKPGVHTVKILPPDLANWLTDVQNDTISLVAGENKVRFYRLRRSVFLASSPAGAEVYIHDSLAGITPLVLPINSAGEPSFIALKKPGFRTDSLQLWEAPRGYLSIPLTPEWQSGPENRAASLFQRQDHSTRRLFITGAAIVAAGAATAYLKIRADNKQDLYLQTGDPALLAERQRLDRGSAVALVVTQIGFGLFVYYLLSE